MTGCPFKVGDIVVMNDAGRAHLLGFGIDVDAYSRFYAGTFRVKAIRMRAASDILLKSSISFEPAAWASSEFYSLAEATPQACPRCGAPAEPGADGTLRCIELFMSGCGHVWSRSA